MTVVTYEDRESEITLCYFVTAGGRSGDVESKNRLDRRERQRSWYRGRVSNWERTDRC